MPKRDNQNRAVHDGSIKKEFLFYIDYVELAPRLVSWVTLKFGKKKYRVGALWDTGATNSALTKECVKKLKLKPVGVEVQLTTASGEETAKQYEVDVVLGDIIIQKVQPVLISYTDPYDEDVYFIVGMDIISKGTFSCAKFGDELVGYFFTESEPTLTNRK